jgi:hypothetical protein
MPVSTPPPRKKPSEKEIEAVINKGGSVRTEENGSTFKIKSFSVKLLSSTLEQIDELRAKRPRKPTSPKLGISTHDWIVEAILEKVEREKKKYNIK